MQWYANNQDDNAFFGQVLYTIGPDVDKPLSVIRMNYLDRHDSLGNAATLALRPPLDVFPLWSVYGHFEDFTLDSIATPAGMRYTAFYYDYGFPQAYNNVPGVAVVSWMGSLLEEKSDQSGTQYSRARSYDPSTGRFTQEDPLGLGGGLNAYGFANGDPINYSDPFGLCPQWIDGKPCTVTFDGISFSAGWLLWNGSISAGEYNDGHVGGYYATVGAPTGLSTLPSPSQKHKWLPTISVTVVYGGSESVESFSGKGEAVSASVNAGVWTIGGDQSDNASGKGWSANAGVAPPGLPVTLGGGPTNTWVFWQSVNSPPRRAPQQFQTDATSVAGP